MANINIPSSLTTSAQLPIDSKTYRKTLSELTTFTTSDVYMFYTGMKVDVAENNKSYIWRQGDENETPVSNTFTYPAGHIVDGFDYGNKTFGFYEIIINSETPDNRIIYDTDVQNEPYTTPGGWGITEYKGNIYSQTDTDINPTPDNYKTQHFYFSPIVSSTIRIFKMDAIPGQPDGRDIPIRLEYTGPTDPTTIGPGGQFETVDDAIDAGEDNLILVPHPVGEVIITKPIPGNVTIEAPNDIIIKGPIDGGPIFTNNGSIQKIKVNPGTVITLKNPLVSAAGTGTFEIFGGGTIQSDTLTNPLIDAISIKEAVGATVLEEGLNIYIHDVNINIDNNVICSVKDGVILNIDNVNIKSASTSNIIIVNNAKLNINNSNLNLQSDSVISTVNDSEIIINNSNIKGTVETLINVGAIVSGNSSKVIINNSNLDNLVNESLINTLDDPLNVDLTKLRINNTLVKDITKISKDLTIKQSNVQSETEGVSQTLLKFESRIAASAVLPDSSLFINTQGETDQSKWFIDFTIKP